MNERIRELADKAAKYSATMFLPTGENGDELFIEKLAELIVRECMDNLAWHGHDEAVSQLDWFLRAKIRS